MKRKGNKILTLGLVSIVVFACSSNSLEAGIFKRKPKTVSQETTNNGTTKENKKNTKKEKSQKNTEIPVQPTINQENKANLSISKEELSVVAEKIFKNEAGGVKNNLVSWNSGENFPSLGIGHFIWYKKGEKGAFEESFPPLVQFYKSKNIKLPKILGNNQYAPWKNKKEFDALKAQKNADIQELINFLYNTKDVQIEFIFERLEDSLNKMLAVAKDKENVKKQFYRVANSPNGLYPLIDYVNFKGEGTTATENYRGEGWGLLQVLENMEGTETGKAALVEFSNSAKFVLERRVKNSDPARNEKKWLQGWLNRCNTYKQ
jgi:hypothetical protein